MTMNGRTASLVLSAALFTASSVTAQTLAPERTRAAVFVHVTTIDRVGGFTLNALREEATRIWAQHRVSIRWGSELPPATAGYQAVVPLIFDHRKMSEWADGPHDSLARTVFFGRTQTVYVSMDRVWRMLRAFRSSIPGIDADTSREIRAGVLMGRVVAHELGHVLLMTVRHSTEGLMRPTFSLRDVIGNEEALTALMPADSEKLAMRFSLPAPVPATVLARRPPPR
jgi:hypothetical protein